MAIQQKAPSQKENLSSEGHMTYTLSRQNTPKKKKEEPIMSPDVPTGIRVDLIQTFVVFIVIVGILGAIYFTVK